MQQKSNAQLLREYAEHGTETAFSEIVARHTNLEPPQFQPPPPLPGQRRLPPQLQPPPKSSP